MSTIVKIHPKGQVTLPIRLRTQAGLAEGDLMEAVYERGKIVLTPKSAMNRSGCRNAGDEYTPEQHRVIDAQLAKSLEDVKQGRTYGPFKTHEDMMGFLHSRARDRVKARKTRKRRIG